MDQKEFQDLLRKYREGKCTSQEQKIVDDWFAAISTETKAFSDSEAEGDVKKRSWNFVERYIRRSQKKLGGGRDIRFNTWSFLGIAASILLAGILFIYSQTKDTSFPGLPKSFREIAHETKSVTNEGTEPLNYSLPEGSKITLMPGSYISFSASFRGQKREIFLVGEAFFEVARDENRPFLVYTNELTTEVLGTSFLVSAYQSQQEIVVTVKTGRVSVYKNVIDESPSEESPEIILTPNQQAIYNTGEKITLKKLVNDPEVILPQPTLQYRYTNTSVIDILLSLEENYGIDIQYDSVVLANCSLTSDMADEGFYEQIKILCNALGAEYELSENAVIIKATGCNPY